MSLLRGTVTDNQDPMQRGRCRVRVWGMHKEDDGMLPWAETAGSTMFGLHKGVGYSGVLQVGTTVWVQFEQQDIQCPVIVGVFVGHDVENMGDISPENSDFHPDAKGDKYGQVWMFNTPAGNSFKMDDAEPRIHIKTPNGFELDLDDNNRRIRLGTPCGPEIVMECDGKLKISNGCTSITMDGCNPIVVDGDMVVNGHITAQGVFAPNLCYCNSPGSKFEGSMSSQESKQNETNKKCNPTVGDNGETSCHADFPPQASKDGLDDRMIQLVDEAAAIYAELYGGKDGSFKICEGKMSPDRYNCLVQSGQDVPKQMVCGKGVLVSPHDKDCAENFKNYSDGDYSDLGDIGNCDRSVQLAKLIMQKLQSSGYSLAEQNHFLAHVDHETGGLKFLEERGNAVYGKYQNRSLYNGKNYKGRGILHLTWFDNYALFGKSVGDSSIATNPEKVASDIKLAVESGFWYWEYRKKFPGSFKTDVNQSTLESVKKTSKGVNGGYNGLEDRQNKWKEYNSGAGTIRKLAKQTC